MYAYIRVCACKCKRKTAVLSQQGRIWQSADRQMSVLTTNQNKSMKNTDLFPKCKLCQHVKERTFEGEIFPFRHDKVTMLFSNNMGIIHTKKLSLSGDNESVEIDRER